MAERRVVLLGSAGTSTAFAAACALRRVWSQSVVVVAMDINPKHLVTASLLADHFEQVPLSASPEFPEALLAIVQRYGITDYLPLLPEEIVVASKLRDERIMPTALRVLAPPSAASAACADKWALSQLLSRFGVSVPRTALASHAWPFDEYFLKPNGGTGSRGARMVKKSELHSLTASDPTAWIVQEVCARPEVTVDSFYDPRNEFNHTVCRERIETKAGVSTKARLFMDDELACFARSIAKALSLSASFCFQVMRKAADWTVTDVNPRPGAGTAMSALTGNDFFAASFAHNWGEDVRRFFRPFEGEKFVTRQYSEFLMGPAA